MNQRILELANQAGAEIKIIHGDILYISKAELDIEKFAKLIVKECAKVNYNSPFKDGEFHARELLEHFGVEE